MLTGASAGDTSPSFSMIGWGISNTVCQSCHSEATRRLQQHLCGSSTKVISSQVKTSWRHRYLSGWWHSQHVFNMFPPLAVELHSTAVAPSPPSSTILPMSLRDFIEQAAASGDLITIERPVRVQHELANVAHALEGRLVLFNNIVDYPGWRIIAGPCSDRKYFSMALGVPVPELV